MWYARSGVPAAYAVSMTDDDGLRVRVLEVGRVVEVDVGVRYAVEQQHPSAGRSGSVVTTAQW